jgi:hypothetical protein
MRSREDRIGGVGCASRAMGWLMVAAALVLLVGAGTATAVTLPTSGLKPCACTGSITKAEVCQYKSAYEFAGNCQCDTAFTFTAQASWSADTKTASEGIHLSTGQTAYTKTTCPADPWLNNVTCSTLQITPQSFMTTWQVLSIPNIPFTSPAVGAAQRQQYLAQAQQPCTLPVHRAPKVESPTQNQAFTSPTHQIQVTLQKTDTDPAFAYAADYTESWKFMVELEQTDLTPRELPKAKAASPASSHIATKAPAASAPTMHTLAPLAPIAPINCQASGYGSAMPTLDLGKFRLRARVWSPKQHDGAWSSWVNFEVK